LGKNKIDLPRPLSEQKKKNIQNLIESKQINQPGQVQNIVNVMQREKEYSKIYAEIEKEKQEISKTSQTGIFQKQAELQQAQAKSTQKQLTNTNLPITLTQPTYKIEGGTSFDYKRPISQSETMIVKQEELELFAAGQRKMTPEEIKTSQNAMISTFKTSPPNNYFKFQEDFIKTGMVTPGKDEFKIQTEIRIAEIGLERNRDVGGKSLIKEFELGTGLFALKLGTEFVPKVKETLPPALAFAGLGIIAPEIIIPIVAVSSPFIAKDIIGKVQTEGFISTAASETPRFMTFYGAGKFASAIKTPSIKLWQTLEPVKLEVVSELPNDLKIFSEYKTTKQDTFNLKNKIEISKYEIFKYKSATFSSNILGQSITQTLVPLVIPKILPILTGFPLIIGRTKTKAEISGRGKPIGYNPKGKGFVSSERTTTTQVFSGKNIPAKYLQNQEESIRKNKPFNKPFSDNLLGNPKRVTEYKQLSESLIQYSSRIEILKPIDQQFQVTSYFKKIGIISSDTNNLPLWSLRQIDHNLFFFQYSYFEVVMLYSLLIFVFFNDEYF